MIDHGMGLNSAFLHLSEIDVKVGDRVRQGQAIARLGASGRATGPHLHWSLKWRDARIDPRLEIGRASCRDRVCQYVWISVVAVSLKKKNRDETYSGSKSN